MQFSAYFQLTCQMSSLAESLIWNLDDSEMEESALTPVALGAALLAALEDHLKIKIRRVTSARSKQSPLAPKSWLLRAAETRQKFIGILQSFPSMWKTA